MPALGITGGIGTGKSTFAALLLRYLPAQLFDADRCSHELMAHDPVVRGAIQEAFGSHIYNSEGLPDRAQLRETVFSDPVQRQRLESILHPAIRARWIALAREARQGWLCVDIPLLFETGAENHFDRIIVVACSAQTQLERLERERALPRALAERMIAAQHDLGAKIQKSHHLVWNDSTTSCLDRQARLLADWLHG